MDAVEEVKSRLSIEDVVSEYVELKRAGRNFKALSPFTNERSPSFMVSPEKQIWHDFSSGKGGSVFTFVMEMEGLDFRGALELLARKANVDLSQYQTRGRYSGKNKERLYDVLEAATHFYQVQFSQHNMALEYIFKNRKFTKETALRWRLGYSPNTGRALMDFLVKKGFTVDEIKRAGLSAQRFKGPGDMFRGRLMIPLQDPQGRVIGFTARLLADDPNAPKYINTPQTILYDKGRHVFGLHLAKETIRKGGFAVVVEGNMDVIASHQAEVTQVVATAGTALTDMHMKTIARFSQDVRLAFDQDNAGVSATERAIPIAGKTDVTLSIITIPQGKDPDELIRKDPALWKIAITERQYALDWLIEKYKNQLNIASAEGKRQFSDVILKVVRQLPDPVEQDHYMQEIARIIQVSPRALNEKLQGIKKAPPIVRRTVHPKQSVDPILIDQTKSQNHFLALLLMRPPLRHGIKNVSESMFVSEQGRTLFAILRDHKERIVTSPEMAELKEISDYVKMLLLLYEEVYQGIEPQEVAREAERLRLHLIEQFVKNKKAILIREMRKEPDKEQQYLSEVLRLDALLRSNREGGTHAKEDKTTE